MQNNLQWVHANNHTRTHLVDVSGETLSVDKTVNRTAFIRINGKSNQAVTTQGKNLWRNKLLPLTASGVTITYDSTTDEYILNGTATAGGNVYIMPNNVPIFLVSAGQKLSLSVWRISGTNSNTVYPYIRSADNITINRDVGLSSVATTNTTFTTLAVDSECTRMYFYILSDTIFVNLRIRVQVEVGNATNWERFIPNSPSPYYPSPINSVANFDLVSCGKNLFDINSTYTSQAGINTILDLPNNSISGLAQDGSASYCFNNKILPYFGACRYSAVFQGIPRLLIRLLDGNKNNISNSVSATGWTYNGFYNALHSSESRSAAFYTSNVNVKFIQFGFVFRGSNINARVSISNIQLEVENIETPFKTYKGQTIHFSDTYRSLPDETCDYRIKDNVNKTDKIYVYIWEKVFDGTETFVVSQGSTTSKPTEFRYLYTLPVGQRPPQIDTAVLVQCTHLTATTANSTYLKQIVNSVSGYGNDRIAIYIDNAQFPTTDSLRTWIAAQYAAGTPFKVQGKLATPQIIDLPYEAVKTYYPHTNIYTTASVRPLLNGKIRIIGGK